MSGFHYLESIPVQSFLDSRGNLGVSDFGDVPRFKVHRFYYITSVPQGVGRGAHGHKKLEQIFYCLKGSFRLTVTDGVNSDSTLLHELGDGYYVPSGLWRDVDNFSQDCVCLVLASSPYEKSDYIFDFEEYKVWRAAL